MKTKFKEKLIFGFLVLSLAIGVWYLAVVEGLTQPVIDKYATARLQLGKQCSFVFAAADTTKTCTLGLDFWNSELHSLKLIIPAFSATTPTVTISILDPAGSTIYSQASIAESTTTYIPLSRPLTFGSSYVILLSTTAGTGGGTVTVDSWIYK